MTKQVKILTEVVELAYEAIHEIEDGAASNLNRMRREGNHGPGRNNRQSAENGRGQNPNYREVRGRHMTAMDCIQSITGTFLRKTQKSFRQGLIAAMGGKLNWKIP